MNATSRCYYVVLDRAVQTMACGLVVAPDGDPTAAWQIFNLDTSNGTTGPVHLVSSPGEMGKRLTLDPGNALYRPDGLRPPTDVIDAVPAPVLAPLKVQSILEPGLPLRAPADPNLRTPGAVFAITGIGFGQGAGTAEQTAPPRANRVGSSRGERPPAAN